MAINVGRLNTMHTNVMDMDNQGRSEAAAECNGTRI